MALKSWIASANDPDCDFPLENLPYGVFRHDGRTRVGVAVGDRILDLRACAEHGLLCAVPCDALEGCGGQCVNALMACGTRASSALRSRLASLLDDRAASEIKARVEPLLFPMDEADMQLPAVIGDYTDFYASIHHATRMGRRFRPDNPLLPNYKYVPIGYHGRASSIVVSGTEIRRPSGQIKPQGASEPQFGPSRALDFELEVGVLVGAGNPLGQSIPIAEAEEHIFGLCLLNDWSARDIQSWEYQPLGPFLGKDFATTLSPWVVPWEALAPYRVPVGPRPAGDPEPLSYLQSPSAERDGIDLTVEAYLESRNMREAGTAPALVSRANLRELYWSLAQLVAHHASNGCNLRPGDLLATGTVSGADEGSEGCLLEKQRDGKGIQLPNGEVRAFLEDGDRVIFRAFCKRDSLPRIGFGECVGMIVGDREL